MPVKPLSFKGDKKSSSKKRKHDESSLIPSASSKFNTTSTPADEDDSWTTPNLPSDLNGPTIIVLPTQPPTCLASDANGNVFASPLENMIEEDPRTAEPHDVRQVWVASKIAGMSEGEVGFKGVHGGWLGSDEYGILGARREARGVEENFGIELLTHDDNEADVVQQQQQQQSNPGFRIRTAATKKDSKKYLCAITQSQSQSQTKPHPNDNDDDNSDPASPPPQKKISISLRGDGTLPSPSPPTTSPTSLTTPTTPIDPTHLILRMQSRFLPRTHAQQSEARSKEKISRRELEIAVGRKLEDDEVKKLKRAKRNGDFYEEVLDFRAKGKHDKFA